MGLETFVELRIKRRSLSIRSAACISFRRVHRIIPTVHGSLILILIKLKKAKTNAPRLFLKNGRHIVLDVSFGSIMNQIQRTAQFRYLLDNRIRSLRKQYSVDVTEEPFE